MPIYQIYHTCIETEFPFQTHLLPGNGPVELTFDMIVQPPDPILNKLQPSYIGRERSPDGFPTYVMYTQGNTTILRVYSTIDFYISDINITVRINPGEDLEWVEIYFLSSALVYWLEMRGNLALHASAVTIGKGAIAFLGNSGKGKSTLAASFLQSGASLLTDDVLFIRQMNKKWMAFPGYPQMRLTTHAIQSVFGNVAKIYQSDRNKLRIKLNWDEKPSDLSNIMFFQAHPQPLQVVYILQRSQDSEICIYQFAPQEALRALLRNSFMGSSLKACNWQSRRIMDLAQLIQQIPVCCLRYPRNLDALPAVRQAIMNYIDYADSTNTTFQFSTRNTKL